MEEDTFWVLAVVVAGVFLLCLNTWHKRSLKRLSPQERAKLDAEEKTEMNIW